MNKVWDFFGNFSKYFLVNDNDHCIKPKSVLYFPCL